MVIRNAPNTEPWSGELEEEIPGPAPAVTARLTPIAFNDPRDLEISPSQDQIVEAMEGLFDSRARAGDLDTLPNDTVGVGFLTTINRASVTQPKHFNQEKVVAP